MAKNVIIMIGDGMGWESARAAAIQQQINDGNTGNTLDDFYTEGYGSGLAMQELENKSLVTTYGTTIAPANGTFSTTLSALTATDSDSFDSTADYTLQTFLDGDHLFLENVADAPELEDIVLNFDLPFQFGDDSVVEDFFFDPDLGLDIIEGDVNNEDFAVGTLVRYNPEKGGLLPWDSAYYEDRDNPPEGFDKDYIKSFYPDSANTASTLYTGVKSYNAAISKDIFEMDWETILEYAHSINKSAGVVSSVPLNHATPGAAEAHVNNRNKYDDDFPALDNILQQALRQTQPDVILGGGHPDAGANGYAEPDYQYVKESTLNALRDDSDPNGYGYEFVERTPDAGNVLLDVAAEIDVEAGERLIGLFGARGQGFNLPWLTADEDYSNTGLSGRTDTDRPLEAGETVESFIETELDYNPTLSELTMAALDILEDDDEGFWLMVEGGDIDWAKHDNSLDNMIGATFSFDEAVADVVEWIEDNGGFEENLLIVTADHDHYLTLEENFPQLLREQGAEALTAAESVADAGHFWGSDDEEKYGWGTHTNRPVPVYYEGDGSEVLTNLIGEEIESYGFEVDGVDGMVDQSHIHTAMIEAITPEPPESTIDEILEIWEDATIDYVMVAAHRGGYFRNGVTVRPENSIASIENSIILGAEMVELDVLKSSDGHYVIMHDQTIDRTTTGTGRVDELTLEELKEVNLIVEDTGVITSQKIPTLEEAYEAVDDQIMFNVDIKLPIQDLVDVMNIARDMGVDEEVVIKNRVNTEAELQGVQNTLSQLPFPVKFMPIFDDNILSDESDLPFIETVFEELQPDAVELLVRPEDDSTEFIDDPGFLFSEDFKELAEEYDVRLWINTLFSTRQRGDLNGNRNDFFAFNNPDQLDEVFGFWAEAGATVMQTDESLLALDYLNENGFRDLEPEIDVPKFVSGTPDADTFDSAFPDEKMFVGDEQILSTGGGDDYVDVSQVGVGNRIDTGSGNDIVFVGTNNRVVLGAGDDIIFAGSGQGANRISLGAGNDQLWLTEDDNAIPPNPNRVSDFNPDDDVIGFANTVLSLGNKGNLWDYEQVNNDVIISAFGQEIAQLLNTTVTDANFVFA